MLRLTLTFVALSLSVFAADMAIAQHSYVTPGGVTVNVDQSGREYWTGLKPSPQQETSYHQNTNGNNWGNRPLDQNRPGWRHPRPAHIPSHPQVNQLQKFAPHKPVVRPGTNYPVRSTHYVPQQRAYPNHVHPPQNRQQYHRGPAPSGLGIQFGRSISGGMQRGGQRGPVTGGIGTNYGAGFGGNIGLDPRTGRVTGELNAGVQGMLEGQFGGAGAIIGKAIGGGKSIGIKF